LIVQDGHRTRVEGLDQDVARGLDQHLAARVEQLADEGESRGLGQRLAASATGSP